MGYSGAYISRYARFEYLMVIKRMIDPPNFGEAVSLPSPRTTDAAGFNDGYEIKPISPNDSKVIDE